MVVNGQDFSPDLVKEIEAIIAADPAMSRRTLSVEVCRRLNWRGPNGRLKEMSCRVALLTLERRGELKLPEPRAGPPKGLTKQPSQAMQAVEPVSCDLEALGGICLVRIDSRSSHEGKAWNALMRAHYLGAGPLCGAQMRYLIRSANYGWLGCLAFSAAAWQLEVRDRWIGWSTRARREHLDQVVCNSRFLILPQVQVPNLASHVLGLAAKQLGQDWLERYGVVPVLLETFVEPGRFHGTCYQAANWEHLGRTKGRGRQDSNRTASLRIKDVYAYPLVREFRAVLLDVASGPESVVELPQNEDVEAESWAEAEFGQADLGDRRLTRRLVTIVSDFSARPERSIPKACQGHARTKAAYRFFAHDEVGLDTILKPHTEATVERLREEKTILAAQDTTSLNYTAHRAVQNLGPIGSRVDKSVGLMLHETVAFTTEGLALGILQAHCWARDPKDFGKKRRPAKTPIEQKESYNWLASFNKVAEAQKRCPNTRLVSVGDREADIYELFDLAAQDESNPKLLVRALHDRLLGEEQGHLWQRMAAQPVSAIQEVEVPRREKRPARVTLVQVRFAQVSLKPPIGKPKGKGKLASLTAWAVLAREEHPPVDTEPLEWMLLTTIPVTTIEQALEKVAWYTIRWQIEVFHRTLKSGCKIEDRQLGTADRIEACLAIDMVVAWRIIHLVWLGRKVPNVSCEVYFEEAAWKALVAYQTGNPAPPDKPPTLH
ncbi:MAG: IS4 family transposase [Chloroflexi bacterium]|nr:IS4 family transposase [Chloroflexota bacterium]